MQTHDCVSYVGLSDKAGRLQLIWGRGRSLIPTSRAHGLWRTLHFASTKSIYSSGFLLYSSISVPVLSSTKSSNKYKIKLNKNKNKKIEQYTHHITANTHIAITIIIIISWGGGSTSFYLALTRMFPCMHTCTSVHFSRCKKSKRESKHHYTNAVFFFFPQQQREARGWQDDNEHDNNDVCMQAWHAQFDQKRWLTPD